MSEATLTWVLLLIGFASLLLASSSVRRRRTPYDLRPIKGYDRLPLTVDEGVESDLPLHFSWGASAVGGESTLTALASAEIMLALVKRVSFSRRLPLVTLSDPISLAVAGDTLRRAYLYRNNLEAWRFTAAVWLPQGDRSLAFAAGATTLAADKNVAHHILLGKFGAEIAYFGESSIRRDQNLIANSTALEGQSLAYAFADTSIIGEELFVGGAYFNRTNPLQMGSLITLDVLRWLMVLVILVGVLVNAVRN